MMPIMTMLAASDYSVVFLVLLVNASSHDSQREREGGGGGRERVRVEYELLPTALMCFKEKIIIVARL